MQNQPDSHQHHGHQHQDGQKMHMKVTDEVLKGRYSNMAQVSHTKEEFVLDFFLAHPPAGQLLDRIILSPGHMKRLANALKENLERYEKSFGKVEEAQIPTGGGMGFKAE